jgi:hypothetical protein
MSQGIDSLVVESWNETNLPYLVCLCLKIEGATENVNPKAQPIPKRITRASIFS